MKAKASMRALGLLLVLALVGAMLVPAVSAVDIETIKKYSVSQNDAFNGAKNELSKFINAGVMSKDDYSIEMLKNEPTLIYDANGLLLYYQFPIEKEGKNMGYIRASASKVLGAPVSVIKDNPDETDYDRLLTQAEERYGEEMSTSEKTIYSEIIVYDHSYLAILLQIEDLKGQTREMIVDLNDDVLYDDAKDSEAIDKFSVYANIDSSKIDDQVRSWTAQFNEKIQDSTKSTEYLDLWTLGNLISQPNDYWCAVTTGKMIAYWFGVSDSFTDIAEIMDSIDQYGNPIGTPDHYAELDYYTNDPDGLQLSTLYRSGSQVIYYEGKNHIHDNENPIASTVPSSLGYTHARAIAGYYQTDSVEYFRVYDPDPSSAGRSWENFATAGIVGWIFVGW